MTACVKCKRDFFPTWKWCLHCQGIRQAKASEYQRQKRAKKRWDKILGVDSQLALTEKERGDAIERLNKLCDEVKPYKSPFIGMKKSLTSAAHAIIDLNEGRDTCLDTRYHRDYLGIMVDGTTSSYSWNGISVPPDDELV